MNAKQIFVASALLFHRADVDAAVASAPNPIIVSDQCTDEPGLPKQRLLVRKRVKGDILAIGADGKPTVLRATSVLLVCRGGKTNINDSEWEENCQSSLIICPVGGAKLTTDDVPGLHNYKADGGEQKERLVLDLFPIPNEGAALVRVGFTTEEDCCGNETKSTEHSLYLVHVHGLRKVLAYKANTKITTDEKVASRSLLRTLTTKNRGLTDLTLETIKTSSGDRKRPRTIRNFVWTGDFYDSCGAGCGSGQQCCNGICEQNKDRSDKLCREDKAPPPKNPEIRSAP